MKIKVCVAGATGQVGRVLSKAIVQTDDLELVGAVSPGSQGKNLGMLMDLPELALSISGTIEDALQVPTDVLVDYTRADVVKKHVLTALNKGVHVVIGSSGLTENDFVEIEKLAITKSLGVFAAGNFAITAALLQYFAQIAARYVPHWEILDYGMAKKIDAPSGTTRELAKKLSQIKQPIFEIPIENTLGDHKARGASLQGSQVHSLRLPGFLSSAEIVFGLPGERLSIRHDSVDSAEPYVYGSLLAIRKVPSIKGLMRGMEQLMNLSV